MRVAWVCHDIGKERVCHCIRIALIEDESLMEKM